MRKKAGIWKISQKLLDVFSWFIGFFFIRFAKKVFVFGKVFVSKMYSLKQTNNPKRIHISKRIVFKRILFSMPWTKTASNIRILRKRILTFRIHFWNYRKTNTLRSITLKFSSRKRILWKLKKRINKKPMPTPNPKVKKCEISRRERGLPQDPYP